MSCACCDESPSDRRVLSFRVHGMDGAAEIARLKREVGPLAGGEERLSFDLLRGRMAVEALPSVSAEAVLAAALRAGLRAEEWREEAHAPIRPGLPPRLVLLTAVSGLSLAAGFAAQIQGAGGFLPALESPTVPPFALAAYLLAVLAGAGPVLPRACRSALRLRPDMNLLMTLAVAGAGVLGQWSEAATVSFLFALALALESYGVGRVRREVEKLLDLAPPAARLLDASGEGRQVPPEEVPVGSRLRVQPGEKVPLDGTVAEGAGEVDQSPITGESVPAAKGPGDPVFAGTINGNGTLVVVTTKPAGDTTLAHIVRLVREAQARRSSSERWVDRFALVYTPAVLALALGVFLAGGASRGAFYQALVLLVIGCPCALVISTPVSVVAAIAAAARHGVLVKGGAHLEECGRIRAAAFDKTGTLTAGVPAVVEVVPLSGHDEQALLERACALEAHSDHPVARAISGYARSLGVLPRPAEGFEALQGRGALARVEGRRFWVGSHRYLEERGQETGDLHDRLDAMAADGQTAVVVGNEEHVCGIVAVADAVRPGAAAAVRALKENGVARVVMLTGDNAGTAGRIARAIGVDEVHADLLPQDKAARVEELVRRFRHVAMVGDGVNDAPAMARASLGIAMGAAGSDAAIETADIALLADDLSRLPWLIRLSRRTFAIVRLNIAFALGVKAVFVALACFGAASLFTAIAADMAASLLVIGNGLRLLRTGR